MDYLTGPEITHDASHHLWVCVGPNHSGGGQGGPVGVGRRWTRRLRNKCIGTGGRGFSSRAVSVTPN